MNDNIRKSLILFSLHFFILWTFEKSAGYAEVTLEKPVLNITEPFIDVQLNSTLYIECTGRMPLSWGYKDPKNRNKKYQDVKTVVHTSEDDEGHKSIIQIVFTTILQTGEYACYYNDISAPLYIFVNDDSHLLLPLHYFPFLTLHEGVPSVIPCLPTVSSANVSLWKVKQPIVEKIELNDGLKYDFTEGFVLRNPTNFFKGNFYCSAEYQNRSENLTLNIDVLSQTQSVPEIYIDDRNAKYVLLNSTFTLVCKVKIKLGTNINRPKWSYPVTDEKRVLIGDPVIKKTTIHRMISETLTVTNVQKSDEGIYQCNVTDHSNRENYHEVEVKVYENVQQPVINFTKALDRIVEIQGENVDLIATFTVFPFTSDIRSSWTKNGNHLPLASTKYILKPSDSVFILEILNLSRSDAGIYTVTAHTSGRTFNKSFHLYVKDTPVVKVQNSSCCFIPGHAYQLQCESNGYPIPNLSWKWAPMVDCSGVACDDKKNWRNIDEARSANNDTQWFMNIDEENVWSLMNVTAQHSGYYKCISQNEMGIAEEEMQFIVSDIKSGFYIDVDETSPLEKDLFFMDCRVSSFLYKDIYWRWTPYYSNESDLIIPDELLTKSIANNSITVKFQLDNIYLNHTGSYKCVAIPRQNSTPEEQSLFIRVREIQEPHFITSNWKVELTAEANSVLELDCSVDGTPWPKVRWYRNGELLVSNLTGFRFENNFQILIISRLVEEDSGDYKCRAENVAGVIMRNATLSVSSSGVPVSVVQTNPQSMQNWIIAGFILLLAVILLAIFARWFYRKKNTRMKLQGFNHQLFQEGHFGLFDPNMPLEDQADLLPYDERWEFPKESLKFGRTLGQGAFGRVIKAEAFGLNDYEKSTTVAVKMLKERANVNQQIALSAELKILIHLGHHVNIVNLMGAVTKNISQGELLVMVEYCRYGNLRNYLLRHREKFINEMDPNSRNQVFLSDSPPLDSNITCFTEVKFDSFMSSSGSGSTVFAVDNPNYRQRISSIVSGDPKGSTLSSTSHVMGRSMSCSSGSESRYYCRVDSQEHVITTSDLLCFAFQCACGMEYLASKKLIHRDLAARNVLLADDKIVKICDFGLAKDCYKYENYVKKGDGPLPIKWMAIESIRDHVFTIKSDVWSFGILMWEFFTLGSNPYPGVEIDEEFYKRLNVGYRMEKPDYCPENIYYIMQDCWQDNPDDRPEFSQLSDTLGGLIETGVKQHYIDLNAPYLEMNNKMQNHTYLNLPDDEGRSSPTRLYMNSVTNSSFFYDTVPPVKRSVSDEPGSKETLEDVPMIQLDTIKENQYEKNAQHEDHCLPPSDYLKMGESCSR